ARMPGRLRRARGPELQDLCVARDRRRRVAGRPALESPGDALAATRVKAAARVPLSPTGVCDGLIVYVARERPQSPYQLSTARAVHCIFQPLTVRALCFRLVRFT